MKPKEVEQNCLRQQSHRTVGDRDGIGRLGLIVKRRNIAKCSARAEHFQDLLTTFLRRRLASHSSAQHNAEPFGRIAFAEDHFTGPIVAFEKAWDELSDPAQRQRGKVRGLLQQLELG
jgi:hypothetical protein